MRYRTRPVESVEVDAEQWLSDAYLTDHRILDQTSEYFTTNYSEYWFPKPGQWVVINKTGTVELLEPDIFAQTYESVQS